MLTDWCEQSERGIVLIIDEVDTASHNQVFFDFLARLRGRNISRDTDGIPAFQSVILAGVTDVKHLKNKIRDEADAKQNSPWNIAADFTIDMSLSETGIQGMLENYEADYQTGMNTAKVAKQIRDMNNEEAEKRFVEEEAREKFLTYLSPIINGTGTHDIEPQTRDRKRMDVVIHYLGKRYIIELKIWRGSGYHEKGEKNLLST